MILNSYTIKRFKVLEIINNDDNSDARLSSINGTNHLI